MPREVFTAGQVLTAAELNVVSDQSVMVFAGTAARGSAIPSPTEGMVTYLADADELQVYTTDWGAVGPGKILQVVSETRTTSFTTTSTSFVDVVTANITPSSTSSKIYISVSGVFGNSNANEATFIDLERDSTRIAQSTGSGTSDQTANSYLGSGSASNGMSVEFLDSPSTTSAITYRLKVRSTSAASTAVVGRNPGDDNFRSITTLTVMEVAG